MTQNQIEIEDIDRDILEELEGLWVPEEKLNDPFFIEGNFLWKRWMDKIMDEFRSIGKVAYLDSKIVGMIQYLPKPEQKVVEIKSVFVEEGEKDIVIRKSLLEETIREFKRPKGYFGDERAKALVTLYDSSPSSIENTEFYKKYGFKQLSSDYDNVLYYPLTEDHTEYGVMIERSDMHIDELEKNKALILCNPHSPYCVEEMINLLEELRKLNAEIPVKLVVPFEEPDEFNPVFSMPLSLMINGKHIGFSILDDENFLDRMKEALDPRSELVENMIEPNSPKVSKN